MKKIIILIFSFILLFSLFSYAQIKSNAYNSNSSQQKINDYRHNEHINWNMHQHRKFSKGNYTVELWKEWGIMK